jgi:hypothetical protein
VSACASVRMRVYVYVCACANAENKTDDEQLKTYTTSTQQDKHRMNNRTKNRTSQLPHRLSASAYTRCASITCTKEHTGAIETHVRTHSNTHTHTHTMNTNNEKQNSQLPHRLSASAHTRCVSDVSFSATQNANTHKNTYNHTR